LVWLIVVLTVLKSESYCPRPVAPALTEFNILT
jgi:hypothetical protein